MLYVLLIESFFQNSKLSDNNLENINWIIPTSFKLISITAVDIQGYSSLNQYYLENILTPRKRLIEVERILRDPNYQSEKDQKRYQEKKIN